MRDLDEPSNLVIGIDFLWLQGCLHNQKQASDACLFAIRSGRRHGYDVNGKRRGDGEEDEIRMQSIELARGNCDDGRDEE